MKLSDVRPDFQNEIGGILEVRLLRRIGIKPKIAQRGRKDIVRRIEHVNAAIFESRDVLRFENGVPTVDPGIGTEYLLRHLHVVADAGRAPHVVGAVLVAWVIDSELFRHERPSIGEIGQFRLVELLEHIGLDLALQEIGGRNDEVIARFSRQQTRLQRLIGVESVVDDLDPGFLGELLEHPRRHIVRPVIEVDDPLISPRRRHHHTQQHGNREKESYFLAPHRRCTASDKRSSAVSSVESFLAKQKRTTEVTAAFS